MKENRAFNWDDLLERIAEKNIIPVIGPGLYRVDADGKKNIYLYDFLADRVTENTSDPIPIDVCHRFSKAAFRFLRKNNADFRAMKALKRLLTEAMASVKPVTLTENPLMKLARINSFNLFINTSYDNFLIDALKIARRHPCSFLNYSLKDRKLNRITDVLFDRLERREETLVYNIYGNLRERIFPAFTERDILETVVSFQKDMEINPTNRLFQELQGNSLLFIGCGYDDWLFRFFVRTVSNQPYETNRDPACLSWKFVADEFPDREDLVSGQLFLQNLFLQPNFDSFSQ